MADEVEQDEDQNSLGQMNVLCCFCASPIANNANEPCQLVVTTNSGLWQVWYCHASCFKNRLGSMPDAPDFFSPAHF